MAASLGTLTLDLIARTAGFNSGMQQAERQTSRSMQNIQQQSQRASQAVQNSMNGASRAVTSLAATAGIGFSAAQVIQYADSYTGLKNQLILATSSQNELQAAMKSTFDISQRTGSAWSNTASLYQKFAQNSKELGLSQARVAAITETVSKAVSLSGGSAESASAAIVQFTQGVSSGVLRGEEFNSVMEQAPGLAKALADGLGIPVGKLRALAQEGKITSTAMIDALEKVAPKVAESFDKTTFTIGQNLTKLKNSAIQFVGTNDSGSASALAGSIGKLAENLDLVADTGAAVAIGYVTKAMVASTAAGYTKISQIAAQIQLEQTAMALAMRQAQAEKNAAAAEMSQARAAVTAAEMKVAADRQVMAANIQTLQSTQQQYRAELQLEQQRLRAQINQIGRTASVTRMAQLRQAETVVVRQLQAAEAQLAATTVASSAEYTAARTVQTAATDRLAVSTGRLNGLQAASAAGAGLLARAGTGLLGVFGGAAGLVGIAAAVAVGFYLMRDSSDDAVQGLDIQKSSVQELIKKYKELNAEQRLFLTNELKDQLSSQKMQLNAVSASMTAYAQTFKDGFSAEKAAAIDAYFSAIRKGGTEAENALTVLQQTKVLSTEQITEVAKFGDKYKQSAISVQDLSSKLGEVKTQVESNTTATDKHNAALARQRVNAEQAATSIKKITDELLKNSAEVQVQTALITKNGLSPALAKVIAQAAIEAQKAGSAITPMQVQKIMNIQNQMEKNNLILDSANQKEQERLKIMQQQAQMIKLNANTLKLAQQYNFADVEKRYGLPAGLASAQADKESSGNRVAVSPMGAKGLFQFMPAAAERFKISGKEFDVAASKEAYGQYMKFLYNRYKDWDKAIMAYNMGEGNMDKVQKGKKSIPLESADYLKGVKARMGSMGGGLIGTESYEDMYKQAVDFTEQRKKLDYDLATDLQKIAVDRDNKLAEIDLAYYDDPKVKQKRIDRVNAEFMAEKAAIDQRQLQIALDIDQQILSAEQLVSRKLEITKKGYDSEIQFTEDQRAKLKLTADKQAQAEVDQIRLSEKQAMLSAKQSYMSQMDYVKQRYQLEREEIALTQGKSEEWKKSALQSSKTNEGIERQSIEASAFGTFSSAFVLDDAAVLQNQYDSELTQQGELLNQKLINYEQYQQSYASITEKYMRQEQEQQYSLQNSMLGQAATVWGGMTELVKKSSGESSGAFKAMFLVQQAFAVAQALINTEVAATQALTLGPILGIPAATIVRGLGYASVGLIAAQTVAGLAGYSDGGYTGAGGKYEPKGIVHAGEVVWSQDDIKNWGGVNAVESIRTSGRLDRAPSRRNAAGGNVYVNNYGSEKVTATQDNAGNTHVTIGDVRNEIARLAPSAVASDLSGSNSVTRRAVAGAFNVAPNR